MQRLLTGKCFVLVELQEEIPGENTNLGDAADDPAELTEFPNENVLLDVQTGAESKELLSCFSEVFGLAAVVTGVGKTKPSAFPCSSLSSSVVVLVAATFSLH